MTYQFTEITFTMLTAYAAPIAAIVSGTLAGVLKGWF